MNKRKRRPVTPEMKQLFRDWKATSKRYGNGDPFNEIETIEVYEGIDDKPADAICVADLLEHLPDPRRALQEIKRLARKSVGLLIMPDVLRNREAWERIIGEYFPIAGVDVCANGALWIQASATNPFGSKNVVAAGTAEGRWENLVANCKVTDKRIKRVPAHDRVAVIACYGPSLGSTLRFLIDETKDTKRDLISVSGSHDFLIDHGIVPRYHVECDPRPHKADNITKGHKDVGYLLGSMVHPALMDKLEGMNITLWHPTSERNVDIKDRLEPAALFVGGGGNVGLRSLVLFHILGYRSFSIYGMDCSFSSDGQMWAGAHAQKKDHIDHGKMRINCDGREFLTAPLYVTYANAFFDTTKVLPDAEFRVFGDGLLRAMAAQLYKTAEAA